MTDWPAVVFHPSQQPQALERELTRALRTGVVPPKFHYLTHRQAQRWLDIHARYAPSNDGARMHAAAFAAVSSQLETRAVRIVGLGCGGGEKDAALARRLVRAGHRVGYVASDASPSLVLEAAERVARAGVRPEAIARLAIDLGATGELGAWLPATRAETRVLCCFGMLPNTPAGPLLRGLKQLLRRGDWLLVSANLKGSGGLEAIRPQYDNAPTRRWLSTLLEDLGLECRPEQLALSVVEPSGGRPGRFELAYRLERAASVPLGGRVVQLPRGHRLRVFYSQRFTRVGMERLLSAQGLSPVGSWLLPNSEEGVWLCRAKTRPASR